MFTINELNGLVDLSFAGSSENDITYYDEQKSFKRFLLELTVQVDRWNLIADSYYFNSLVKEYVCKNLIDLEYSDNKETISFWGKNLYFVDGFPVDKVLCVSSSLLASPISRNVSLGVVNYEEIK